jgi:hypothetical protein
MAGKTWQELAKNVQVQAKPEGLWTPAVEYVGDKKLLKIEVRDTKAHWEYADGKSCGPDGDTKAQFKVGTLLLENAPVGALIGKVGGSTAGSADGKVFVVGRFCIIRLDDKIEGPLFLTINDTSNGFHDNRHALAVTVSEAL